VHSIQTMIASRSAPAGALRLAADGDRETIT
jgi:hypothetical protein